LGVLAAVAAAVAVSIAAPHFAHFIFGASRSAATEYFAWHCGQVTAIDIMGPDPSRGDILRRTDDESRGRGNSTSARGNSSR
jgi:hypothetical protein